MFREVKTGYEQLIDPAKRKQYDADYANWTYHTSVTKPTYVFTEILPKNKKSTKRSMLWLSLSGFCGSLLILKDDRLQLNRFLSGLFGAITLNVFLSPF